MGWPTSCVGAVLGTRVSWCTVVHCHALPCTAMHCHALPCMHCITRHRHQPMLCVGRGLCVVGALSPGGDGGGGGEVAVAAMQCMRMWQECECGRSKKEYYPKLSCLLASACVARLDRQEEGRSAREAYIRDTCHDAQFRYSCIYTVVYAVRATTTPWPWRRLTAALVHIGRIWNKSCVRKPHQRGERREA